MRNTRGEAITLLAIGDIYGDLSDYQSALQFYEQALPLTRTTGDRTGEAVSLNNIGFATAMQGKQEDALGFYNQALAIRRAMRDKGSESSILINIGAAHAALGKPESALGLTTRRFAQDINRDRKVWRLFTQHRATQWNYATIGRS